MRRKEIEAAIARASDLLRNVKEPRKSLAFPSVLALVLQDGPRGSEPAQKRIQRFPREANKKPTRASTLRGLIAEGWFKSERTLAQVKRELRNRALPTKTTTLPSLLLPLVLAGRLKRKVLTEGKKEIYVYFS